ncbi:hypothetical protein D3C87_1055070 [compost metagenome]
MACRNSQRCLLTSIQTNIPKVDRRESHAGTLVSFVITRNHAHGACIIWQSNAGNRLVLNALIARFCHFVFLRQIHPQLHHFKSSTAFCEFFTVEFFMHESRSCGHPLHVAGFNHTTTTGRISMFDFAGINHSHCFKSTMRMFAHTFTMLRWWKFRRSCIIHQKERREVFRQIIITKDRTNWETIADPMTGVTLLRE